MSGWLHPDRRRRAARTPFGPLLVLAVLQLASVGCSWAQSGILGIPRDKLSVPLSPVGPQGASRSNCDLSDEMLLEAPGDPAKKYYIPRYRLFTRQTTAGQTHRMALLQTDGSDWLFTVHLEAYPADALRDRVREAVPLNYAYPTSLSYTTPDGVEKKLTFRPADIAVVKGGLRATLRLPQKDSDEYYAALADPASKTSLIVERRLQAALPVELVNPEAARLQQLLARYETMQPVTVRRRHTGGTEFGVGLGPEFLVENLNGRATLESGDTVVLHTLDGGVVAGVPWSDPSAQERPLKRTARQDPPSGEQRMRLLRLGTASVNWSDQGDDSERTLSESAGRIHIGPYFDFGRPDEDIFNISFPALAANGQVDSKGWSNGDSYLARPIFAWIFEPPRENGAAVPLLANYVKSTRDKLAALPRLYAENDFHLCAVNLLQSVAPTPFVFSPVREAYVFAGINPPALSGLIPYRIGSAIYLQDGNKLETFYYLPDRYELATRDGPGLAVRATEVEDKYLLEYSLVPVTAASRLENDRKALLDQAKVGAVNYLPYRGERPGLSIVVPSDDPGKPAETLQRPDAVTDLTLEVHDSLYLSAQQLRALWNALFDANSPILTGTVSLAELQTRIPLGARLPGASPSALWAKVFDPRIPSFLTKQVTVNGEGALKTAAQSVVVEFEGGRAIATLTPARPEVPVQVQVQPIGAYLLGQASKGDYRYRVTLVDKKTGAPRTGDWQTGETDLLRIQAR